MQHDNAEVRVLGYLGRALSLELSAVQLYSTQAQLVKVWGLAEVAEKFSAEAREEMSHADRIISRMVALGYAPNASQLRPVKLGSELTELLQHDLHFEQELVGLYQEAVNHCTRENDNDNRVFFQGLLEEEQAHERELKQWMRELSAPAV